MNASRLTTFCLHLLDKINHDPLVALYHTWSHNKRNLHRSAGLSVLGNTLNSVRMSLGAEKLFKLDLKSSASGEKNVPQTGVLLLVTLRFGIDLTPFDASFPYPPGKRNRSGDDVVTETDFLCRTSYCNMVFINPLFLRKQDGLCLLDTARTKQPGGFGCGILLSEGFDCPSSGYS